MHRYFCPKCDKCFQHRSAWNAQKLCDQHIRYGHCESRDMKSLYSVNGVTRY